MSQQAVVEQIGTRLREIGGESFTDEALNVLINGYLERFCTSLTAKDEDFISTLNDLLSPQNSQDLLNNWVASDFVANLCIRSPELLVDLLSGGDLQRDFDIEDFVSAFNARLSEPLDEAQLTIALRQFRQQAYLRLSWRDVVGLASTAQSCKELAAIADAVIREGLNWAMKWESESCGQPVGEHSGEQQELVILGMGKLGGEELNYSSDIDLIFVFPETGHTQGGQRSLTNNEFFTRVARRLIRMLDAYTEHGRVFRVDMRLRPFGEAGPLVISFDAFEEYYQAHGRDWERYALLKARAITGKPEFKQQLSELIRPFVFRRYIDFGIIDELRTIKSMISRQERRRGMEQNVKLGPGGIREAEFIVQSFQLVRGGREQALRVRNFQQALNHIVECDLMNQQHADKLAEAYWFLRRVENAVQMYADQQAHDLPADGVQQQRLAHLMGYADWSEFTTVLDQHRRQVHEFFEQTFVAPQSQACEEDSQVTWSRFWRDEMEAEDALAWLEEQGFNDAEAAMKRISGFRGSARFRALKATSLKRLDTLMPLLLPAVAMNQQADETLARIMELIEAIGGRSAYMALLVENPMALSQLVQLCSASPWISAQLSRFPLLLDELLDPRSLYAPQHKPALMHEIQSRLTAVADDEEQVLDCLRQFKNANVMRVAAADIAGRYPLMVVSDHLTDIAESVLAQALDLAYAHLSKRYGEPRCVVDGVEQTPGFAIVAYGKMGGIELSYGSDLDLVFIHGSRGTKQQTNGATVVDNPVFFARLGQRIIHILTTPTASGVLYEVDMRLRPDGASGLLVTNMESFSDYQHNKAWTWEHQALTRARVVAGDSELGQEFERLRQQVLGRERDKNTLQEEVRDMRHRMRRELEKHEPGRFDLKQGAGGIADIEFMVQYGVLAWGNECPALLRWTDNIRILESFADNGYIASADARLLINAYRFFRAEAHKKTLQGEQAMADLDQVDAVREPVQALWQRIMETQ